MNNIDIVCVDVNTILHRICSKSQTNDQFKNNWDEITEYNDKSFHDHKIRSALKHPSCKKIDPVVLPPPTVRKLPQTEYFDNKIVRV